MHPDHSLCHVRIAPLRANETLAMTLSYQPSTRATTGAIVASPLPFLGGDMQNNVTRILANVLTANGLPTLRYDYRSVGESHDVVPGEARYETWRRVEETGDRSAVRDDAAEALRRARHFFAPALLAGYSFGCWTAAHTASLLELPLPLVLVAPPLAHIDLAPVATHKAPVLLIFAGDDALAPTPSAEELHSSFPHAQTLLFAGADHFFRDHEDELKDAIGSFVRHAVAEAEGRRPATPQGAQP